MKAKSVLNILNISRQTLTKYVKSGKLRVKKTPGGDYDYDAESVYEAKNGFQRRAVGICIGNVEDSMREKCEKIVEQFICDNMDKEQIWIYDDNGERNERGIDEAISDALGFRLKKLYVLEASREINSLEVLDQAFASVNCEVGILRCYEDSAQWGDESEESLLSFVRRAMGTTKDRKFREKLECIERILRM